MNVCMYVFKVEYTTQKNVKQSKTNIKKYYKISKDVKKRKKILNVMKKNVKTCINKCGKTHC